MKYSVHIRGVILTSKPKSSAFIASLLRQMHSHLVYDEWNSVFTGLDSISTSILSIFVGKVDPSVVQLTAWSNSM